MIPPILMPQLQTKTPTRGSWPVTSVSGGKFRLFLGRAPGGAQEFARGRGGRRGLHHRLGDVLGGLKGAADINPGFAGGHRGKG